MIQVQRKLSAKGLLDKKTALFLLSQNVSLFGSSVVGFAIIWYITLETSSGIWLTMSTICSMLPQVIVSLWGGVLADRYPRKYLIMLSDGFIALSTLALTILFLSGVRSMGLLLAVSAVRSIGAGIQTPAVSAIYPQLVSEDKLTRVQGINQTLNSVLLLLSPAVGGMMLGTMDIAYTFLLDVVTAAFAIIIVACIKVGPPPRTQAPQSMFSDLKAGVVYTFSQPFLRRLILCFAVSFFLFTPAAVLTPLLIERSFGSDVWMLTANEIVWTVGSLIGGIFVSMHGDFKKEVRAISICLLAFGLTFALLGVAGTFPIYLIIIGVAGFFMPVVSTVQTVLLQKRVEPDKLGRVFSLIQILSASAMPLSILLFGPLADVVSVEIILIVTGLLLALTGILYHYSSRER